MVDGWILDGLLFYDECELFLIFIGDWLVDLCLDWGLLGELINQPLMNSKRSSRKDQKEEWKEWKIFGYIILYILVAIKK